MTDEPLEPTETRYRVPHINAPQDPGELAASRQEAEEQAQTVAEELRAELDANPYVTDDQAAAALEATELEPERVEVLVDGYNVVSERDGEIVIAGVAKGIAEAELERLTRERLEQAAAAPVHAYARITEEGARTLGIPDVAGALVPLEATPHPGYRLEPAAPRIILPVLPDARQEA